MRSVLREDAEATLARLALPLDHVVDIELRRGREQVGG